MGVVYLPADRPEARSLSTAPGTTACACGAGRGRVLAVVAARLCLACDLKAGRRHSGLPGESSKGFGKAQVVSSRIVEQTHVFGRPHPIPRQLHGDRRRRLSSPAQEPGFSPSSWRSPPLPSGHQTGPGRGTSPKRSASICRAGRSCLDRCEVAVARHVTQRCRLRCCREAPAIGGWPGPVSTAHAGGLADATFQPSASGLRARTSPPSHQR